MEKNDVQVCQSCWVDQPSFRRLWLDVQVGGEDGFEGGEAGPSPPSRAARALQSC